MHRYTLYTYTHITHTMHGHTHAQRFIKGIEEMARWVEHSLCKCDRPGLESPEPCEAGWVAHTGNSIALVVIWRQRQEIPCKFTSQLA